MWSSWVTTERIGGSSTDLEEANNLTTAEEDVKGSEWTSLQEALQALSTPADEGSVISTRRLYGDQVVTSTAAAPSESPGRRLAEAASQLVSTLTSSFEDFTTTTSVQQKQLLTESDSSIKKHIANVDASNELPNAIKVLSKLTKQNNKNAPVLDQIANKVIPDVSEKNYSAAIFRESGTGLPSGFLASEPQSLTQSRTATDLGLSSSQSGIHVDNSSISTSNSRLQGTGFISSSLQYVDNRFPLTEGALPDMGNLYLDTPRPDSGLNGLNGLNRNIEAPYYLATYGWNFTSNVTERIGALFDEERPPEEFGLAEYLWIYVAPIILIIGCIGNILILLVMAKGKFKGQY